MWSCEESYKSLGEYQCLKLLRVFQLLTKSQAGGCDKSQFPDWSWDGRRGYGQPGEWQTDATDLVRDQVLKAWAGGYCECMSNLQNNEQIKKLTSFT